MNPLVVAVPVEVAVEVAVAVPMTKTMKVMKTMMATVEDYLWFLPMTAVLLQPRLTSVLASKPPQIINSFGQSFFSTWTTKNSR
jgi:hypothetical protein